MLKDQRLRIASSIGAGNGGRTGRTDGRIGG